MNEILILKEALAIITGYLLGSIPSAYIAGRLVKGFDIRKVGGGNMGTLNVMREMGFATGITVFLADIAKGVLAIFIARWLDVPLLFVFITGFAAIAGHDWPVFLKFRGGKGAATAFGVLLALLPVEAGISFGILAITVLITSNVTLGIAIGVFLMPLFTWLFGKETGLIIYPLAIALFLVLRYIPTMKKSFTDPESRRNLIMERRFTPWQTRRK